jgi:predicted phage terminase large subunit-like protein
MRKVGSLVWNALFQQRPSAAEGNLFKRTWLEGRIVSESPPIVRAVRFWDLAATAVGENGNTDPDWTVGLLLGITSGNVYYILDVRRFRESWGEVKRRIRQTAIGDGTKVEVRIEQEGGAQAKGVAQDIVRDVLQGFAAYAVKPRTSKVERSKPAQAAAERGDVWIVAGQWVNAFIDELVTFPNAAHDDQVDGLTGAFEALSSGAREWDASDWGRVFATDDDAEVENFERRILAQQLR